MPAPKRIKECYFYKENNKYHVKLKDPRDNFIKDNIVYESRTEINNFINDLKEGNLSKYCCSALGTTVYNRKPKDRKLMMDSKDIYNTFVKNLTKLSESSEFYKQKVASILSDVSDLMSYDLNNNKDVELSGFPPEHIEIEPVDYIVPTPAIDPSISRDVISMFEVMLNTVINPEDCCFYFQKEKFQLTKSVYDSEVPSPDSPGTSPTILSALDYMITLLGVNADRNKEVGENSFTFAYDEEVYKVKHIYTGSGITHARGDE